MSDRPIVVVSSSSDEGAPEQPPVPLWHLPEMVPPQAQDLILRPCEYHMPMYIPANSCVWIVVDINNAQLSRFMDRDATYRLAYERMGVRIFHRPHLIMENLWGTRIMVCLDNSSTALAHQAILSLRDLGAVLHEVRLDFVASNLNDRPQAERLRIIRHHCSAQGLGSEETSLMMRFADTAEGIQSFGGQDVVRPNVPMDQQQVVPATRPNVAIAGQQPVPGTSQGTVLRGTRAEGYRPPPQDPALLEVGPIEPPTQQEIAASEDYLQRTYGEIYFDSDDTIPPISSEPSPPLTTVETTTSDDPTEIPQPKPYKREPKAE